MNSILILNRRRFLAKHGLDAIDPRMHSGGGMSSSSGDPDHHVPLHAQIVGLLHAVQYLKVPVIACNAVTIVFEMLLGGT